MIKSKFASFKLNPNSTIMEKTPRYTQRERNMVLNYAAQYKDIIENKRTDAESNRKKDEVWTTIAKEFNSRVYHQRTAKQLRQLYKNMKLLLKKDLTTDGRAESFMDILTALQSQNGNVVPSLAHHYSDGRANGKIKQNNNNEKSNSSQTYNNIPNIESDVVIIKSEDLSDNDQSFKHDMDDDSLSNKDIPEVCLEEDDDDAIFDPSCINPVASYLNLQPTSNHHHHSSHHQQQQQQQSQQNLTPQIQLQQLIQQHQQRQQQEIAQNHQQKHLRETRAPSIRRELSISPEPLNFNNSNDERLHNRNSNNNSSYNQNNINGERLQTIQFTTGRRDNQNKNSPIHNINSHSNSPSSINGDDGGGGSGGIRRPTNGGTESLFALAIEERKRKIELLNAQIEYWRTLTKKIKMSSTNDTDLSVGLCNGTCPCSHSVSPTPSVNNNSTKNTSNNNNNINNISNDKNPNNTCNSNINYINNNDNNNNNNVGNNNTNKSNTINNDNNNNNNNNHNNNINIVTEANGNENNNQS